MKGKLSGVERRKGLLHTGRGRSFLGVQNSMWSLISLYEMANRFIGAYFDGE